MGSDTDALLLRAYLAAALSKQSANSVTSSFERLSLGQTGATAAAANAAAASLGTFQSQQRTAAVWLSRNEIPLRRSGIAAPVSPSRSHTCWRVTHYTTLHYYARVRQLMSKPARRWLRAVHLGASHSGLVGVGGSGP